MPRAKLDSIIAAAQLSLQQLKRLRRVASASVAGRASGRARSVSSRNETIWRDYQAGNGQYGAVVRLAAEYGLSERQLGRILRHHRQLAAADRTVTHSSAMQPNDAVLVPATAIEGLAALAILIAPHRPAKATRSSEQQAGLKL